MQASNSDPAKQEENISLNNRNEQNDLRQILDSAFYWDHTKKTTELLISSTFVL